MPAASSSTAKPSSSTARKQAQAKGIVTIYQEFTLAPDMTIAENVFIGREPGSKLFISRKQLEEQTRALTHRIGLDRNPRALVRDLSVAEQQMVEIARALSMKSQLIVMDEPTSALSRTEVEKLFAIIRSLKRDGITTIFVTHRLEEVFEICDRYTVLRDGRHVGSGSVAGTTLDGIIRLMVGRELGLLAPRDTSYATGEVALSVDRPLAPPQEQRRQRHRTAQCFPRREQGRNPRHRRTCRRRPHRNRARHLRRRCDRQRQDHRERASRSRSPRPAMPSLTASALCPKTASSRRCSWRSPSAPIFPSPRTTAFPRFRYLHQQQQGRCPRRGIPEAAQHPHGLRRPARRQSLRRQPAEGGAGALAGAAAQGADRRRADARHRRRRQGRGAQPAVPDGGARASPSS